LEAFLRDFRFALRSLSKDRRFALVAIFALALGIGATTVMFSVVYNVLFQPLPYKDFRKSVVLQITNLANAGGWKGRAAFSSTEYDAFREQNHVFEDIVGHAEVRVFYDDSKSIRRLANGSAVTANTFDYLGVPALVGRTTTPEDGKPGTPPVFVMNNKVWRTEFGGDPGIIGTSFVLNGKPRTLIGIMPP
jgi:putative ABC transport system permease protein